MLDPMVKHVVIWKLKASAASRSAAENAFLMKERLDGLRGKIPGLLSLEVGINRNPAENAGDVVLTTVHENWEALEAYQVHPEHKAIVSLVSEVRETRACVDWEIAE